MRKMGKEKEEEEKRVEGEVDRSRKRGGRRKRRSVTKITRKGKERRMITGRKGKEKIEGREEGETREKGEREAA